MPVVKELTTKQLEKLKALTEGYGTLREMKEKTGVKYDTIRSIRDTGKGFVKNVEPLLQYMRTKRVSKKMV